MVEGMATASVWPSEVLGGGGSKWGTKDNEAWWNIFV